MATKKATARKSTYKPKTKTTSKTQGTAQRRVAGEAPATLASGFKGLNALGPTVEEHRREDHMAANPLDDQPPHVSASETSAPVASAPAKTAKEPSKRARARGAVIRKLVQVNPKVGTARARWDLYAEGMTVQDYLDVGGLMRDIKHDVSHQYVELVNEA